MLLFFITDILDSQTTLSGEIMTMEGDALSNSRKSLRVQRCRVLLKEFKGKMSFQWVPCHCGLLGSETADSLAKTGTAILQKSCRHLSFHYAKLEIKRIFKQ
ncbi:hypothetical protein NPIL_457961 [Nephila pilipes]|uniref:RNase H type-1 domain-containing protein n=1 Tax=Nephila pilipes TaxID=299642 RepID=A0A8X6T757_NEPPI|nr:hypothetical protein NPIL_457961 [Nephila pilipes]